MIFQRWLSSKAAQGRRLPAQLDEDPPRSVALLFYSHLTSIDDFVGELFGLEQVRIGVR